MSKKEREHRVLIGLLDYYIRTGKPVGSNTLKEEGFGMLSSATIRNYFADLEAAGFLQQQHSSGGRLPTQMAFRFYAAHVMDEVSKGVDVPFSHPSELDVVDSADTRAVSAFLQRAVEIFSAHTGSVAFLSAPRFDQDFVVDIKLVAIDRYRCLCVIITDFGTVQSEVMHIGDKLSSFALKRIETYCHAKLRGIELPKLSREEITLAEELYKELMVRYMVSYAHFSQELVYTAGMARLLACSEFQDVRSLTGGLEVFEDQKALRLLIQSASQQKGVSCWIGDELATFGCGEAQCSVITLPYRLHQQTVGVLGLLGPIRMPYRERLLALQHYVEVISEALTHALYKHKISYRQPRRASFYLNGQAQKLLAGWSGQG